MPDIPTRRSYHAFFRGSLAIGLLLTAAPAFGDVPVSRERAVAYALTHGEAARAHEATAQATKADGDLAAAFIYPQAAISAHFLEMDDNAGTPPVPWLASPSRDHEAGWRASQLVFAGGRMGDAISLRDAMSREADVSLASNRRDIARSVRLAFDAVLYQKAVLNILEDRIKQRSEELSDATDLREAGVVTGLDVRQARLDLNGALTQRDAGQAAHDNALVDFTLAIGRSVGGSDGKTPDGGADDSPWIPEGNLDDPVDTGRLLGELAERLERDALLDISASRAMTEVARLRRDMAAGERWPELSLVASGEASGERADDLDRAWRIGMELSWSAFDGGRVRAATAAASARTRAAEENMARTRKSLAGEIRRLRVDLESLDRRVTRQRENVSLAQQNYDDARAQYRAGTITQVTLGLYHLAYAENRFALQQLFFDRRRAIIDAESLAEGTAESSPLP